MGVDSDVVRNVRGGDGSATADPKLSSDASAGIIPSAVNIDCSTATSTNGNPQISIHPANMQMGRSLARGSPCIREFALVAQVVLMSADRASSSLATAKRWVPLPTTG